ncbi:MAG: hypothetical protein U9O18_05905, partial [Chloroflexota bacterium]|nr:hypothetical protein [Chloroflexota bacterium]
MTRTRSRRHGFAAMWLAAAMLVVAGTSAVTLGAEASPQPDAATSPVPEVSAEPTPEPTPYPVFDPSDVSIRTDLFVDGLDAPVYLTDDG